MSNIKALSYSAVFKAVISNNKLLLSKIIQVILDYWNININISDKEITIKTN